jgi:hypothetical protein
MGGSPDSMDAGQNLISASQNLINASQNSMVADRFTMVGRLFPMVERLGFAIVRPTSVILDRSGPLPASNRGVSLPVGTFGPLVGTGRRPVRAGTATPSRTIRAGNSDPRRGRGLDGLSQQLLLLAGGFLLGFLEAHVRSVIGMLGTLPAATLGKLKPAVVAYVINL